MIHREATDETIHIVVAAALATSHLAKQSPLAFLQGSSSSSSRFHSHTAAVPARDSPLHFDGQLCMNLLRL